MPPLLPEQIFTPRLLLRRPAESDARSIFQEYAQDPQVCRYLLWRPHQSVDTVREFLSHSLAAWSGDLRRPYVITETGSDAAIGMIDARRQGYTFELGYVLGRAHWGKGYMPEAIAAVAAPALESGGFRVQAVCDVENLQSQRALEKAGFAREARLERYMVHPNVAAHPRPCFMYARWR
jgi:[ribosomal protein S5]-alanine N-acetyltransferase